MIASEANVIIRCLESLRQGAQVDAICISTNKTDQATYTKIHDYKEEHNLKIRIFNDEWQSFGHNRTLSFQNTIKYATELGFKLNHSYALLLDADMVIKVNKDFRNLLKNECYQLIQKTKYLSYYNIRLIRLDFKAVCKFRTHEVWQIPNSEVIDPKIVYIIDYNDGGSKSDKYQRDLKFLLLDLIDYPNEPRIVFYLAQTYSCLQKYQQAIKTYRQRMEMGAGIEEIWYSAYQIANCNLKLNHIKMAKTYFRQALNLLPARAEAYFGLAEIYTQKNKIDKALNYYLLTLKCDPTKFSLFVEFDKYQTLPMYRIAKLYLQKGDIINASKYLLTLRLDLNLVKNRKNIVHNDLYHQAYQLEFSSTLTLPENLTNPSLIFDNSCFWVQLQKDIENGTRNVFLKYTTDFRMLEGFDICDHNQTHKPKGLSEMRLFMSAQRLAGIATSYKMTGTAQQLTFKITRDGFQDFNFISKANRDIEQNWLPTQDGNYFICSHQPVKVLNSKAQIKYQYPLVVDLSFIQGGTQIIKYQEGYLALVNALGVNEQNQYYFHHFIFYDAQFKPYALSIPIKFSKQLFEVARGLDIYNQKLYIAYEAPKYQSWVSVLALDKIRQIPRVDF